MENINDVDPLEAADVTAAPGQSQEVNTQPPETTDTPSNEGASEEEGGEVSNPWDDDPKFKGKSPEDIYQAYQESQKVIGQNSNKAEVANLVEKKYGLTPEQFKAKIEAQEEHDRQERYQNDPTAEMSDKVQNLEDKITRQEHEVAYNAEEKVLDKFLASDEGKAYAPFKEKIFKLGLGSEQDKSYEDIAKEWFGEARSQGQNDAYNKIETKKMTQATGVSNKAPAGKPTLEQLKGMSSAEQAQILS